MKGYPMKKKRICVFTLAAGLSLSFSLVAQTQDENLQRIDRILEKAMIDWKSPGLAISIVKDDSIIFARGYGVRELGKPHKVDEYTLFAVGSQTKAFTAAGLAMLVDDKKMDWDDPVVKYLPEFQLRDPWITQELTIRDCLTHRTGFESLIMPWILTSHDRNEILRRYRYARPVHRFRSAFNYNNIMFLLAGQLISSITGMSWDEFVKKRIFEPLQMNSSNTSITDFTSEANTASPHEIIDDRVQPTPWRNLDNIGAAGSINSNVMEMAQRLRLQLGKGKVEGKRFISPGAMKEMHSPQQIVTSLGPWAANPQVPYHVISLPESRFMTYGLGWFVQEYQGHVIIHHPGDTDGLRCQAGLIPELNLGVVIFSNLHPSTLVDALLFSVFDVFIGRESRDWSGEVLASVKELQARMAGIQRRALMPAQGTSPSRSLEAYTGLYENDLYGQARVTYENGKLMLYLGQIESPLEHLQGNTFRISTPIIYVGRMPVTFILNNNGIIGELNLLGIIDFKRVSENR